MVAIKDADFSDVDALFCCLPHGTTQVSDLGRRLYVIWYLRFIDTTYNLLYYVLSNFFFRFSKIFQEIIKGLNNELKIVDLSAVCFCWFCLCAFFGPFCTCTIFKLWCLFRTSDYEMLVNTRNGMVSLTSLQNCRSDISLFCSQSLRIRCILTKHVFFSSIYIYIYVERSGVWFDRDS